MTVQSQIAFPTDLLRIADLNAPQLLRLLDLAAAIKVAPEEWRDALRGRSLACFFEKPSTRTRVSFAAAAYGLGMLPVMLRPDELQIGRGEPIADTARVLSSYTAAIVMRTFAQRTLDEVAAAASVPVINALSNDHHPCQALADLLTLREHFGRLAGLRLAYVGDGNNVAHSLMEAGALAGMDVVVATPPSCGPDPAIEAMARRLARGWGGSVTVVHDPYAAVGGADVIYTDVWSSMGAEAEHALWIEDLKPYQINRQLMMAAQPHTVFMHCLPAHRGQEVTAEVIDGPASLVWRQAANRMPTEQAILHALLCAEDAEVDLLCDIL